MTFRVMEDTLCWHQRQPSKLRPKSQKGQRLHEKYHYFRVKIHPTTQDDRMTKQSHEKYHNFRLKTHLEDRMTKQSNALTSLPPQKTPYNMERAKRNEQTTKKQITFDSLRLTSLLPAMEVKTQTTSTKILPPQPLTSDRIFRHNPLHNSTHITSRTKNKAQWDNQHELTRSRSPRLFSPSMRFRVWIKIGPFCFFVQGKSTPRHH